MSRAAPVTVAAATGPAGARRWLRSVPTRPLRPAVTVRYAGLLGAGLLATAGWLGGVPERWTPNQTPSGLLGAGHGWLLPVWALGLALAVGAWWLGRHVVPSTRWAYVTAGLWLLPMLLVPAVLGSRDGYSYACQGHVYAAGADPYSAGLGALGCPWLDSTAPIWRGSPAPYGPLFLALAGGAARLGGSLAGTLAWLRLIAVGGVLLAAVFLPALARRAGVPPSRAGWLLLACPLVGVHLVGGVHNDAIMIGLLVAGLATVAAARPLPSAARPAIHPSAGAAAAVSAGHPPAGGLTAVVGAPAAGWVRLVAGGALLGLAVAVKGTAVVLVPFAALAAAGAPAPIRALLTRGGAVVGAALAALAAVSVGTGLGFGWLRGLAHSGSSVQWTSPPTAVGMTVHYLGRPVGLDLPGVPIARALGLLVLGAVLAWLCGRAWRGDPLRYAALALAATVALAPVFHPWYATWPLALLAATARARPWWLAPGAVAAVLALPDGTNLALWTALPGALAMTAAVAVVVVRVARQARRPRRGPSGE